MVARLAGYATASAYVAAFHREVGTTPARYFGLRARLLDVSILGGFARLGSIRPPRRGQRRTPCRTTSHSCATKDAQGHLGPDEAQQVLERYLAWSATLADAGTLQTGGALSASTEIVGGYIVITADDPDHAERVFSDHPHLAFGSIELRKVGENGCEP